MHDAASLDADQEADTGDECGVVGPQQLDDVIDLIIRMIELLLAKQVMSALGHQRHGHRTEG